VYAGDRSRSTEQNPKHIYVVPGVYTVSLRVRGPNGEDETVKKHYIRVGPQMGGRSGGGRTDQDTKRGRLFGETPRRPDVEFDPKAVDPITREGEWVEKEKTVYSERGRDGGSEERFRDLFPEYQREATESIRRERIPSAAREFVRRYFDGIRPK
jgi:PKD repeat protein